jgi:invasion protein IalB
LFALLFLPATVFAQGEVKAKYGDWDLRCDTPPGAENQQCVIMQFVTAEDRENVGLSVVVMKTADKQARILRVLAPLGVLLPRGLGLRIDDTDMGTTGFIRCLPNGCVSEVLMDDSLIGELRAGKQALFIIFQTPEEGIGFPLGLKGFGEGFDKLP